MDQEQVGEAHAWALRLSSLSVSPPIDGNPPIGAGTMKLLGPTLNYNPQVWVPWDKMQKNRIHMLIVVGIATLRVVDAFLPEDNTSEAVQGVPRHVRDLTMTFRKSGELSATPGMGSISYRGVKKFKLDDRYA